MGKEAIKKNRIFIAVCGVGLGLAINVIYAAVTSGVIPVTAVVLGKCFVSNGVVNFGNYDPVSANALQPLDAVSSFQIACTKGVSAAISLNSGINSGKSSAGSRAMSAGAASGDYIGYELYTTSNRSTIWNMSNVVSYNAQSRATQTISVYGRIPGGQDVGAGYYADTVTITANF